jgi:ribosomal protein L13E
MTKTQKQAVAAKATEAFLLPEMTPYPISVVRNVMQNPWVKVTREARGFYVQASGAGYVVR